MTDPDFGPPSTAQFDPKNLQCVDCGGWPIDNGAVFVAVFLVRKGKSELGGICELCWLKRLQRRGQYVNMSSSPCSQIDLPELGLRRDTDEQAQRRRKDWGI